MEKRKFKESEERSGQFENLVKKLQLEISQYRAFVDGTCEQLFFDDPEMQKKAQQIRLQGINLKGKTNLIKEKIEELETHLK